LLLQGDIWDATLELLKSNLVNQCLLKIRETNTVFELKGCLLGIDFQLVDLVGNSDQPF